ncbi:hypothetical protein C8J57DRAFT_1525866 [Mycena rebaudengoi]|nr:hypothetical protein C8J57DRAFT_1525866 [Mycena rebaudengoi]
MSIRPRHSGSVDICRTIDEDCVCGAAYRSRRRTMVALLRCHEPLSACAQRDARNLSSGNTIIRYPGDLTYTAVLFYGGIDPSLFVLLPDAITITSGLTSDAQHVLGNRDAPFTRLNKWLAILPPPIPRNSYTCEAATFDIGRLRHARPPPCRRGETASYLHMLLLSKKTASAPTSITAAKKKTATSGLNLKPLRIVERLLGAKVIDAVQKQASKPFLKLLKMSQKPRVTVPARSEPLNVSRESATKTKRVPRFSLPNPFPALPKRAPFVVPLHFSAPRVPRTTTKPAPARTRLPKPAPARTRLPTAAARPARSPTVRPPTRPPAARPQVAPALRKSAAPSRIPVFVGRSSTGPKLTILTPTPRSGASRIPRLQYAGCPSPSSSTTTGSVVSFCMQTPCPSPVPGADACHSSKRIIKALSARAEDRSPEPVASTVKAVASATKVQSSNKRVSLIPSPLILEQLSSTAATSSRTGAGHMKQATRATDQKSLLLSQAKTKSTKSKDPVVPAPTGSPSAFKGTSVFVNKSDCHRAYKENLSTSELQQAFVCRTSAVPKKLKSPPPRSPLSLVARSANRDVEVLHSATSGDSTTTRGPLPRVRHTPSSPIDINCTPPGAECITELVTTAFGTRKVRRVIVPPILEDSVPSRDPLIIAELQTLRQQQKVGGGGRRIAKADA